MPILPKREELHAEFTVAVQEIDRSRENSMLTTPWYSQIGDHVFDVGYRALASSCTPTPTEPPRLHVVSAPVGSGKTSFSLAFIAAVVRLSESNADAPRGCLFVVDQTTKADEICGYLASLLPGQVAVWSTEHDPGAKPTRKLQWAGRWTRDDLQKYPVVVVTHAFFTGKNGHKARSVLHQGQLVPRALTMIDERPKGVDFYDIDLADAHTVRKHIQQTQADAELVGPHIDALVSFMDDRGIVVNAAGLEKPTTAPEAWADIVTKVQWFASAQAMEYLASHRSETVNQVFGFARALANDYAFITRYRGGQQGTYFTGYENNLPVGPGTVMLDATADIDGTKQLSLWREYQDAPRAHYDNLDIVHVPSVTTQRLKRYFDLPDQRQTYAGWMVDVIKSHMEPGQHGLVVCHNKLIVEKDVPDVPLPGEDWKLAWDIGGRKLSTTHWGTGIGDNTWKDADVVFLFGEFWIPRRAQIAQAQGIRQHKAYEGDLAAMTTLNSKAPGIDALRDGHLLRWTKQMGLRGKGRNYDGNGYCQPQKIVYTGDLIRLLAHADQLFPGANVRSVPSGQGKKPKQAYALLSLLSRQGLPHRLSQRFLSEQLGRPWRDISKHVMKNESVMQAIENLGWRYVPDKGRRGSAFERIEATPAILAA
jgi:hypothetical protein